MTRAQKKATIEQVLSNKRAAYAQRKAEQDKSMDKRPEYPSSFEYQKIFGQKLEKELSDLAEKHKAAVEEFDKVTDTLAASLVQALPAENAALVQRHLQGQIQKPSGVDEARIKSLEASFENRIVHIEKSAEPKIALIKNEVKQAHENHRELKGSIAHERSDFEKKMAAQQQMIDRLLENQRNLEAQVTRLQNDKNTRPSPRTDDTELRARLDRLEARLTADRDLQNAQNKSLNGDLSVIRIEHGKLKSDVEFLRARTALRSELGDLITDCSAVKTENVRLATGLAQAKEESRALGARLAEYEDMTRKHQVELTKLDVRVLERVAEAWDFEWPNVQYSSRGFHDIKGRVEQLEHASTAATGHKMRIGQLEHDAQKLTETLEEIKGSVGRVSAAQSVQSRESVSRHTSVAARSDKEDQTLQDLKARVLAIESRHQDSDRFEDTALGRLGASVNTLNRKWNSLNERLQQVEARLDQDRQSLMDGLKRVEIRLDELPPEPRPQSLLDLDPEVSKFKIKVEKFEGEFEKLSSEVHDVKGNCEALTHQFTVLDSQYNNITTRPLAEHIIAHMELVYPSNRQILEDLDYLKQRIAKVELDLAHATAAAEGARQRSDVATGNRAASPGPGNKRRRLDEGASGSPRPSLNGV
jgi:chromosome segregation ATPase